MSGAAFEYDRFFTTRERMLALHGERARREAFAARTEAEARDGAKRLRPPLARTLGLDAMTTAPLEAGSRRGATWRSSRSSVSRSRPSRA
jgi:hypothetical protein